ncbi:unnamed protein product, partial [Discosporangium mesarthrocarpum]
RPQRDAKLLALNSLQKLRRAGMTNEREIKVKSSAETNIQLTEGVGEGIPSPIDGNGEDEQGRLMEDVSRTPPFPRMIEGENKLTGEERRAALFRAARAGNLAELRAVLEGLPQLEVVKNLRKKDTQFPWPSLVMEAAKKGNIEVFNEVLGRLPEDKVMRELEERDAEEGTVLMYAAKGGSSAVLGTVLDKISSTREVIYDLTARDCRGTSVLMKAAWCSSVDKTSSADRASSTDTGMSTDTCNSTDIFMRLLDRLPADQLKAELQAGDQLGRTVLMFACRSGMVELVRKVLSLLSPEQVVAELNTKDRRGMNALMYAVKSGSLEMFRDLLARVPRSLVPEQLQAKDNKTNENLVHAAVWSKNVQMLDEVIKKIEEELGSKQMFIMIQERGKVYSPFSRVASWGSSNPEMMRLLIQHGVVPEADALLELAHKALSKNNRVTEQLLEDCFQGALDLAKNPLIPGMNMSVALGSVTQITEGHQVLLRLKDGVDTLVLEVLERLPQTASGFSDGHSSVDHMLQPEYASGTREMREQQPGPLEGARIADHLEFFSTPLLLEFMSLKLSCGLPNPLDTESHMDYHELEGLLQTNFLIGEGRDNQEVQFIQGVTRRSWQHGNSPRVTILPGMQVYTAGLAVKPNAFYEVPSL